MNYLRYDETWANNSAAILKFDPVMMNNTKVAAAERALLGRTVGDAPLMWPHEELPQKHLKDQ